MPTKKKRIGAKKTNKKQIIAFKKILVKFCLTAQMAEWYRASVS